MTDAAIGMIITHSESSSGGCIVFSYLKNQKPKLRGNFGFPKIATDYIIARPMEIFLLVIFLALVLLLCVATLLVVAGLVLYLFGFATTRVPFVPVKSEIVGNIIEALELKENSVLYDLGSGDGRILFAAAEKFPGAKLIGIEKAPLPLLLSKLPIFWHKRTNISVISEDFFNVPLQEATHIFTYLFPETMDELLPKLERELSSGTRLVTCDFVFSKKFPDKEIDLGRGELKLSKKLYVYVF